MRNTIILGSLVALLGLGSAALASDQSGLNDNDTAQVTREASNDGRGDRRHRYERSERSRDRHEFSRTPPFVPREEREPRRPRGS